MESSQYQEAAQAMLKLILECQPQLFSNLTGKQAGQRVAKFCAGFVRQYSEELQRIEQSRP